MKHVRVAAAATVLALVPLAVPVTAAMAAPAIPSRAGIVCLATGDVASQPPRVLRTLPRAVTVQPGQDVVFRLPSNVTTGYEYTVAVVSNTSGATVGKPFYVGPADPIPGRGGTTVLKVKAGHSGLLTLKFTYAQPFGDGGDRVVNRVTITWPN